MKSSCLALTAFLSLTVLGSSAQESLGNPLGGLERLKNFETRRTSSSDPDWKNGNGDLRPIKPGGTLTLAELDGPGKIVHIWFTIAHTDPFYSAKLTLRIYWDGEDIFVRISTAVPPPNSKLVCIAQHWSGDVVQVRYERAQSMWVTVTP